MSKRIVLDPVTRIEGHMKVEVSIDSSNRVTQARVSGNMFRGFEKLLKGRPPRDAVFLTQRICGVCPISHSTAAVKAVENAFGFTPSEQARLLRNIILGANHIDSSITHFYNLALLDYVQGPEMGPWAPGYKADLRFSDTETKDLVNHYISALAIRRKSLEMGAIFGGKIPHAASIMPGGVTANPSQADINNCKIYLSEIQNFITNIYLPDIEVLAGKYSDYFDIGKGYGNLIAYGVFDESERSTLFPAGTVINGSVSNFDVSNISEQVKYSWYTDNSGGKPENEITEENYGKPSAYSWLKSTRYNNLPFEAGPLARNYIKGTYRRGISVMDRHKARGVETELVAKQMYIWLNQLVPNVSGYTPISTLPLTGKGFGLTEAPRGALGHWITVTNSVIENYQIITPTCWNGSPIDNSGNVGPIEKALEGVLIADTTQPVELLRIIHSFDPCMACAVHVIDAEGLEMSRFIVNPHGA